MMAVSYSHLYTSYSLPHIDEPTNKINRRIYTARLGHMLEDSVSIDYAVLNYDKNYLCVNEPMKTRQFRSAIVSHPENELLSFSPPGSISTSRFYEAYPDIKSEEIQITEMIEGNLIHLFYDKRIQSWQIATRGAVGGQYYLYDKLTKEEAKQTTVFDMFLDALGISRSSSLTEFLASFPKFYSYSFVLQHPNNHIVMRIQRPTVYLIGVYDIMPVSMCVMAIPQFVFQGFACFMDVPTIHFPILYSLDESSYTCYADIEKEFSMRRNGDKQVGLNITHLPSGNRCVIRNPVYNEIYKIRYLSTDLQYQYLCLRYIGRVSDFLSYFPQYKGDFYRFYEQTRDFLEGIHKTYMSFYVLKEGIIPSLRYWPYVRRLHKEVYLPSLNKSVETTITRSVVHEFMNKLTPEEWLYALNYDKRESMDSVELL
jgi:hypothetical protein